MALVDEEYISARLACEMVKDLLKQHNFSELLSAIDRADTLGPMLDPTLWRDKRQVMMEDRKVFEVAKRFVEAWPEDKR